MNWPPTKEEWKTIKERMFAPPIDRPQRIVSPKQYDVLRSMLEDGMLDESFNPKSEFIVEYFKRMRK